MRRTHSLVQVGALTRRVLLFLAFAFAPAIAAPPVLAQSAKQQKPAELAQTQSAPPALVRTTTRHELRRFGYGSTLTISGAPIGSVRIEAWQRPELEITADIELRADTEEELALLAAANSFVIDQDVSRIRIITTGTHDRKFMKQAKNFPRKLLGMPWRIDYHLKVPAVVDLEVFAGRGALSIAGVEGSLQLNAGEADATLELSGGDVVATILGGQILMRVPAQSWRGRGASVRLARGTLAVALPVGFNGEIDAAVLRAGRIEDAYGSFAPREHAPADGRELHARAGAGGASLKFEVGDGVIRFEQLNSPARVKR